ncbi:MAG: PIN domain-containing protein [Propionibacteriaceae bacterium]|nr:PIN domain-containing protein [Propionibacteriaceae bacterium]
MTVRFCDTNILLYAISRDDQEEPKATIARGILEDGGIALSVQVLQEFYVQATRATRTDPLTHEQATQFVESFTRFPIQANTLTVMRRALHTRQQFGVSYWDAGIIEAARASGCQQLLSEDLSHGQDYNGIVVINPFV